ncbi:uncharacterized protein [Dysidea avara]|uniref:uncharacterized protein n=1 Tax=Dysidea avara TaxID=196820 RepID=UPI00331B96C3
MPSSCCAVECRNRCKAGKVTLYTFPKNLVRRRQWIQAIHREAWEPTQHSRVCGRHFISGRPCRLKWDPDYVPSIFSFKERNEEADEDKLARSHRLQNRRRGYSSSTHSSTRKASRKCKSTTTRDQVPQVENAEELTSTGNDITDSTGIMDNEILSSAVETMEIDHEQHCDGPDDSSVLHQPRTLSHLAEECLKGYIPSLVMIIHKQQQIIQQQHHVIDALNDKKVSLEKCLDEQKELTEMVKEELQTASVLLSPSLRMKDDDEQTYFYSGLPSYSAFTTLLALLSTVLPPYEHRGISHSDQLLMVLMKLRRATTNQDLAYRFRIDVTRVSKIFHLWIDTMAFQLKPLVKWPERGMIRTTIPDCFKPKYARTTCIIDCSEIFIQRPSSLAARAETYSNYKSHNTVKFLIAISPTGAIIFVSKCWGGRASDKHITAHSGFLDKLMHGDLVLADRGFDITEPLALRGASLAIPPFTKGKPQLSQREVETARELSRVRIHVERAIGRLKNFRILQSTLPITLVKSTTDEEFCTIDKILFVCAALCNLQPPLV